MAIVHGRTADVVGEHAWIYRVEVEVGLPGDPAEFAAEVHATLADVRGWASRGHVFQRVDAETYDFRVVLASPALTDALCAPMTTDGEVSCRNGDDIVLNALRWFTGIEAYGEDLASYRQYLVNHEVGHRLGYRHERCPGAGLPAPVMMQQTYAVGPCLPNPWPLPTERGRRLVDWSLVNVPEGATMALPPLVEPVAELDAAARRRYARHLILPELGLVGQRRLANARILCVGAGGLGSPALLYLAAAGVGTLGIIDADVVDESNLHRQVLHGQSDLGRPKVESALETITDINPLIRVVVHHARLDSTNAMDLLTGYDLVVDGSDNFATRYLVNDACVLSGIPCVWGSIFRFDGQASVFWPAAQGHGPCYRCLYPEPPPVGLVPSCAEGGVLGVLPGVIGSIQATEAIKIIVGIGEPLVGRLFVYDALEMTTRQLQVRRDPNCAVCGDNPTVTQLVDYDEFCGVPAAPTMSYDEQADPLAAATITATELDAMRRRGEDFVLVDVREPYEREIVAIDDSVLISPIRFRDGSAAQNLPRDRPVVLYCHTGVRSARALEVLYDAGFDRALHLDGGIAAWVAEIEPHKPQY